MTRFFWLLIILLLAVIIGIGIAQVPGYVLLEVGNSSVTTPLWLAVLAVLLCCIVVYFVIRFIRLLYLVPKGWRLSFLKSRAKKREKTLKSALNAFLVGDFSEAKKRFKDLASHQHMTPETWLLTSRSAQLAGDRALEMDALHHAAALKLKDRTTLTLLEVDSLVGEQKFIDAKAKLSPLVNTKSKSLPVLQRALSVEQGLQNWSAVIALLPGFKKVFGASQSNNLAIDAYRGLLRSSDSSDRAQVIWSEIPKAMQQESDLLVSYARTLASYKSYELADELLGKALNKMFSEKLFVEYSLLPIKTANRLQQGEHWFGAHAPTANALYAMGNLYAQNQVSAKAQQCYQRALQMSPSEELRSQLASLV